MLGKVFKLVDMEIPVIGMGTMKLTGQTCRHALTSGFHMGYKLIDTNLDFKNSGMIHESLKYSKREEVFIIGKIPNTSLGYAATLEAFSYNLKMFNLEYLDLVLLNSPGQAEIPGKSRMNQRYRSESWRALTDLKKQGVAKHIGVANFLPRHIDGIWDKCPINPAANLIEFHPFCYNEEVYQYHKEKNIQIIAACPLAQAKKELWDSEVLIEMRKKYKMTRSQILLRWAYQKGVVVIPKTKEEMKLKRNSSFDIEITEEDIKIIDGLSQGVRLTWNTESIK